MYLLWKILTLLTFHYISDERYLFSIILHSIVHFFFTELDLFLCILVFRMTACHIFIKMKLLFPLSFIGSKEEKIMLSLWHYFKHNFYNIELNHGIPFIQPLFIFKCSEDFKPFSYKKYFVS